MANFALSTIGMTNNTAAEFEICKTFAKVKFGESYFNAKPGMVLQRNSGGEIIRIYNGYVYDDFAPNLPYWEEGKEGRIIRSFMWLNEAPSFVQSIIEDLENMSRNGHIYGVHNPNRNPLRKRKVIAMIQAARLYSDRATHLIMEAVSAASNIKSKNLIFDRSFTFEECEGGFYKFNGVPPICTKLDGNYTEYVTYRFFCKGEIILKSEYNDCELSPTHWSIVSKKEWEDEEKYYLSHPPISDDE